MYPQLQGLRRIMYHYQMTSASLGMISIISLILATSVYVRLNLRWVQSCIIKYSNFLILSFRSSLSTLFDLPHQQENGEKKWILHFYILTLYETTPFATRELYFCTLLKNMFLSPLSLLNTNIFIFPKWSCVEIQLQLGQNNKNIFIVM